jgi:DHA2 family multidrug resistance protein
MLANGVLFPLFSIACAFTHDLGSMILMRGLQGFAGGVLIPMAFTMVLTKLPKAQQPMGLALFALSVTFAPAIRTRASSCRSSIAPRRMSRGRGRLCLSLASV